MPEGYYFVTPAIAGTSERSELARELDDLGLEHKHANLGSAGEVVDVVVAWFSLHDFWVGVASGLATTQIERIASVVHGWVGRNKRPQENRRNVIKLAIYEGGQATYTLTIDVDSEISGKEIRKIVEGANEAASKSKR